MTTYSISLDDVDLSLLPVRTYESNGFLKKEHYQFRVMREPAREQTPNADITYTCHICAIEVPAAFAREHTASVKHRANASIANVAAQRMRALVHASPVPMVAQPDALFCANCAMVVDEEHDKTKEHRVAVMHDNLLWELMRAYVTDDDSKETSGNKMFKGNEDGIQNNCKNDSYFRNVEENYKICDAKEADTSDNQVRNKTDNIIVTDNVQHIANSKTNDSNAEKHVKNEESIKGDVNENNINTNKTEHIPTINSVVPTTSRWVKIVPQANIAKQNGTSSTDSKNKVANEKETLELKAKHNREPYEKELRKFMDTNNLFQIKESYQKVQIKMNDDTVNVYSDHFHSFHRMYNDGNVECIVCNITFNNKESEEHKYDLNHMTAVAKIGNDGEYVREIKYKLYSHCILCNQKINNVNVVKHKQSQHHALRKSNNVRSTVKTKEAPTTERDDHSNDKINNVKTASTAENDKENNSTSNDQVSSNVGAVDVNKLPYEEIAGELVCRVCDCRVPKDVRNRKDHLKGARHMNNLRIK